MIIKRIAKGKLADYKLNENGLYYKETFIAYGNVTIKAIKKNFYPNKNKFSISYLITIVLPDGTELSTVEVKTLDNISCFGLWGIPDVLSKNAKQLIAQKLQLETVLQEPEICICCHQGYQEYEKLPIWILGDKIIKATRIDKAVTIENPLLYPDTCTDNREYLHKLTGEIISFMPDISIILFYYSLLVIVKPILHEIGIDTNFALAVIGPSGHLKTSLVRKLALWLSDKERQNFKVSSSMRTSRMLEAMDMLSGMNCLVDDLHTYEKSQDIQRQNKRLDDIVRHMESNPACANIILTGEQIQGIFSCIDRLFIINVPRMNADALARLKAKLGDIPDILMATVAYIFAEELIKHIDEVKIESLHYYQEYYCGRLDNKNATRTYQHCCFIGLTEFLYCKYICGGNTKLSAHLELQKAVEKHYEVQQEQLQRLSISEQRNYVFGVADMLYQGDNYLTMITDIDKYENFEESCLVWNNQIYITRNALSYGMMRYYKSSVNIGTIVRAIEGAGMLSRGTDTLTKKLRNRRHYVINGKILKTLYEIHSR